MDFLIIQSHKISHVNAIAIFCITLSSKDIYDPMKKDYPMIFHASYLELERGISSKSLQCDFGESFSTLTVLVSSCYRRIRVWRVVSSSLYSFKLNHSNNIVILFHSYKLWVVNKRVIFTRRKINFSVKSNKNWFLVSYVEYSVSLIIKMILLLT